jgi:hypothetical protein
MSSSNRLPLDIGKEISARELIRDYDSLGIPHFQRGLVWTDENTALLLESLYFNTPCGIIILWEAKDPRKEGIPLPSRPGALPRSGSRKPQYLIVDGQQRIRSLRTALGFFVGPLDTAKNESSGPGPLTPESGGSDGVWCLNLTRVPELAEFFGDDSALRFSMFCLSELTKEKAPRWKNLVPLSTFFGRTEADASGFIATARRGEVLRRIAEIPLTDRIQSLLKNKVFFLKILYEQQNNDISRGSHQAYNLPQVVALYNRINSAGKRVEAEEKAFATLVSLQPSTSEWLSDLFKDVHPEMSDSDLGRDGILKRRKERNFGFKLFMRTFIQVYAYHSRISLGSNSFSFDVINSASFQTKLKKYPENVQQLFERSRDIVKFVRDILGKGLNCDDLQTLPDTISLLPLFQILIRFKPLMKGEYAKVLQGLALRLLLAQNLTQERILGLVKLVNDAVNAKECFEKLEMDPKIEGSDALGKELGKRLKEANSLMNRYVLILYWLLRKRRACDFSYKNLSDDTRLRNELKGLHLEEGKEKVLEVGVTPEKQHIVPYGWLEKLYEIERRGRVSRHEVNNIGNITFISHDLNSIDKGLSDNAISLGNDPPENLAHHFLGEDVGKAYNDAKDLVKELLDKVKDKTQVTPAEREKAKKVFEEFCAQRRDLIQKAFVEWVEDLGPLTVPEGIEAEKRLFDPSRQDWVGDRGTLVPSVRRIISEKEFLDELGKVSPDAVKLVEWAIENAEGHQLKPDWGAQGVSLKYLDDNTGAFSFGQLCKDGSFWPIFWLPRFIKLGLPQEIALNYLDDIIGLIPGSYRKEVGYEHELKSQAIFCPIGTLKYLCLEKLLPVKEKWFEAIDRAIGRICKVQERTHR